MAAESAVRLMNQQPFVVQVLSISDFFGSLREGLVTAVGWPLLHRRHILLGDRQAQIKKI